MIVNLSKGNTLYQWHLCKNELYRRELGGRTVWVFPRTRLGNAALHHSGQEDTVDANRTGDRSGSHSNFLPENQREKVKGAHACSYWPDSHPVWGRDHFWQEGLRRLDPLGQLLVDQVQSQGKLIPGKLPHVIHVAELPGKHTDAEACNVPGESPQTGMSWVSSLYPQPCSCKPLPDGPIGPNAEWTLLRNYALWNYFGVGGTAARWRARPTLKVNNLNINQLINN